MQIAILGAGNGGVTAAADLTMKDFSVRLFDLEQFAHNIRAIEKSGGISFVEQGKETFIKPSLLTTNIDEAIAGADIVLLVVPSDAVEYFAALSAPYLEENQVVMINGAASMGSVRFVNKVRELGVTTNFKICETASLTYGTRVEGNRVELFLRAKKLLFAAYPSQETEELLKLCQLMYPTLVSSKNVLETTLNNGNPETHPGPSLLNAGRIEYSKGEFYLYKEGITDGVVHVIEAVSKERKALCEKLGIAYLKPTSRLVDLGYCEEAPSLVKQYNESPVFTHIKGPLSLTSRYFTEDISMGLVLWSSIGKELNIDTPVIDSIITLSSALLQRDFWKEGLTVEKLQISLKDTL